MAEVAQGVVYLSTLALESSIGRESIPGAAVDVYESKSLRAYSQRHETSMRKGSTHHDRDSSILR